MSYRRDPLAQGRKFLIDTIRAYAEGIGGDESHREWTCVKFSAPERRLNIYARLVHISPVNRDETAVRFTLMMRGPIEDLVQFKSLIEQVILPVKELQVRESRYQHYKELMSADCVFRPDVDTLAEIQAAFLKEHEDTDCSQSGINSQLQ